eukprot:gene9424-19569_t
MKTCLIFFVLSFLVQSLCFIPDHHSAIFSHLNRRKISMNHEQTVKGRPYPILADTINVAPKAGMKVVLARVLGYIMGAGALGLYVPIIYDILIRRSAEGLSTATWVYNLLGFTAGIVYPLKKGFPISSFIDGIALWLQSLIILFLTCFYNNRLVEFSIGMSIYGLLGLYFSRHHVPTEFVGAIQVCSTVACNYAQIPQIILSWKLKSASWSFISAFLSTIGNFLKVFTTIQLTQDRLICFGHVLGFFTNAILLNLFENIQEEIKLKNNVAKEREPKDTLGEIGPQDCMRQEVRDNKKSGESLSLTTIKRLKASSNTNRRSTKEYKSKIK